MQNQLPGALGEIQLSDAINTQASKGDVEIVHFKGDRFDCGSVSGYIDAIMHTARSINDMNI